MCTLPVVEQHFWTTLENWKMVCLRKHWLTFCLYQTMQSHIHLFYFIFNELWENTKGASMRKPVLGACVGSATASLTKVHWWMHFQIPGWFCLIWLLLKKIMNQNWKCQADNEQVLKCTLLLISRTISWNMNLFLMLRHTHLDVFW